MEMNSPAVPMWYKDKSYSALGQFVSIFDEFSFFKFFKFICLIMQFLIKCFLLILYNNQCEPALVKKPQQSNSLEIWLLVGLVQDNLEVNDA